jgi:hypothetical protein
MHQTPWKSPILSDSGPAARRKEGPQCAAGAKPAGLRIRYDIQIDFTIFYVHLQLFFEKSGGGAGAGRQPQKLKIF